MKRLYVGGVTALFALAACGGESTNDALGEAFCADLRSGMTPLQIIMSAGDSVEFDGTRDAAANVAIWVEDHCSDQLRTNDALRGFLEANDIPFDG